ncbi:MAG: PilN domain-containing protein [Elusimicrobia bacterium]|nr:PilN domain-containing protein [Elusimicrobiota bacterium]
MIKINLLPKELQEKDKGLDWVILGYAIIGILIIAGTSIYFIQINDYKKELKKKERWSSQLAGIKAKVAQVEQLDAQKNILNAKKNTVVELVKARLLYPKFMETLYQTLPGDIWLDALSLSEDGQKNLQTILVSNSLTTDSIADWLQSMESNTKLFSNISLSAIEVNEASLPGTSYFKFTLNFTYQPPAAQN